MRAIKWAFAALSLFAIPVVTAGLARAQGDDTDSATLMVVVEDSRITAARDSINGIIKTSALADEDMQNLADYVESFVESYVEMAVQGDQTTLVAMLDGKIAPAVVDSGLASQENAIRYDITAWVNVRLEQTRANTSGNPGFAGSSARTR